MIGCIYARVSDPSQIDKTGFERQIENGRKALEERGAIVPDDLIITEQVSASKVPHQKRKGFKRVLDLASKGAFEVLYVDEASRLSRSEDIEEAAVIVTVMKGYGVEVIIPNMPDPLTPLGKLFLTLQGYISNYENTIRVMRSMPGKRITAQRGKVPSGFGPYGGPYGMKYDKTTGKLHWLSEAHRDRVRDMLTRYADGKSTSNGMAREFNEQNIPSASGGIWWDSAVRKVLVNAKTYAGMWSWDGIDVPGIVTEPCVDMSVVAKIQRKLRTNKQFSSGGRRKWLTGRVFSNCGRRYAIDMSRGAICNGGLGRIPVEHRCHCPRMGARTLERAVHGSLAAALSDPEVLLAEVRKGLQKRQERVKQFDEELERAKNTLDAMHKKRRLISFQHEEGIIDDKEALSKWEALKHEIADQERRVKDLETMTAPEPPLLSEEVFRCNEGALVGGAYEFLMESNNEDLIKLCDKYEVEVRIKSKEEIEIKARLPVELRREFRLKGRPVVAVSAAESVSTSCTRPV